MSASPVARQATQSQTIPSRRVLINDPSQLPIDYSSTPGGTLYSTTPGGTRIVYERATLMHLRNSPIARTPPKNIPDILLKGSPDTLHEPKENGAVVRSPTKKDLERQFLRFKGGCNQKQQNNKINVKTVAIDEKAVVDDSAEQFEMDM